MSGICIDLDKTIGRLKMLANDKKASGAEYLKGVGDATDVVSRQFRVSHDIGTCVWTRSQDGEGMVHYDTSCNNAESFFETIQGMDFTFCPFCGAKIVEEED